MRIHPAGSKRIMVAQTFSEAAPDFNTGMLGTPEIGSSPSLAVPQNNTTDIPQDNEVPEAEVPKHTDGKPDIKNYVAQKLQSFGYPPRRLEQFEDDFVAQKILPGSVREVTIVIPDRYYGT